MLFSNCYSVWTHSAHRSSLWLSRTNAPQIRGWVAFLTWRASWSWNTGWTIWCWVAYVLGVDRKLAAFDWFDECQIRNWLHFPWPARAFSVTPFHLSPSHTPPRVTHRICDFVWRSTRELFHNVHVTAIMTYASDAHRVYNALCRLLRCLCSGFPHHFLSDPDDSTFQ